MSRIHKKNPVIDPVSQARWDAYKSDPRPPNGLPWEWFADCTKCQQSVPTRFLDFRPKGEPMCYDCVVREEASCLVAEKETR